MQQTAIRIIEEHGHKRSLNCDIVTLNVIMPYTDDFALKKFIQPPWIISLVTKKPMVFLLVH